MGAWQLTINDVVWMYNQNWVSFLVGILVLSCTGLESRLCQLYQHVILEMVTGNRSLYACHKLPSHFTTNYHHLSKRHRKYLTKNYHHLSKCDRKYLYNLHDGLVCR